MQNGIISLATKLSLHYTKSMFMRLSVFQSAIVCAGLTMVAPQCWAQGQAQPDAIPPRALFELFDSTLSATRVDIATLNQILAVDDSPETRLDLARHMLDAGEPDTAIALIVPALERVPPTDALLTEMLDLIARAHLVRGDAMTALQAARLAHEAAMHRLGPDNPRLLDRLEALADLVDPDDQAMQDVLAAERSRLAALLDAPATLRAEGKPVAVSVWFGTNRVDQGGSDPASRFGTAAADLTVGQMTVTIPPNHRSGMIERPSIWGLTSHPDPMRHIVLADLHVLAREQFAAGCCNDNDRLLFIHGYNVSFHDGALRAAQLAFDLEFRGQPMYFSWPSRASLLGYLSDNNGVLASRPALVAFLELATRGAGRLHIVAHSMGNRYLLEALDIFMRDYPERSLGQVILGAPDVDRNELAVRMELLRDRALGVTLYASANDIALNVSRHIHGAPRAGDIRGEPVRLAGLTTLDASAIAADSLGHSYFGDAPQVLADILGLVRLGLPPAQRCGTAPLGEPVWAIRPDGCRIEEVRTASDLLDLHGAEALAVAQTRRTEGAGEDLDFWLGVMTLIEDRLRDRAP